ncbi:MAG: protoporphyrinogen oxidase [Acidobacteriaceae bacterium]
MRGTVGQRTGIGAAYAEMKRIAVIGGGIAGVSATYELALQKRAGAPIEFVLFEAASRLGGIVETVHCDDFIIECGPDSWVTEKRWARDLAIELGLEREVLPSQDDRRKTYIAQGQTLTPMPDGMRMIVPTQWASVLNSPLFTWQAKLAYLREPKLAGELKASALDNANSARDESVRDFVLRHFGADVADTIAAPLLSGVLGGDIANLSARAVLPSLIALEREHGSLILGLQQRVRAGNGSASVFTTLRNGLASLIEGMESHLPANTIQRGMTIESIHRSGDGWSLVGASIAEKPELARQTFDAVVVATPATTTEKLLTPLDAKIAELLPRHSSSAIIVALGFCADEARGMRVPRGFGFLVPARSSQGDKVFSTNNVADRALLACTYVDQKFPFRTPAGAILLRAFFGGPAAPALLKQDDAMLIRLASVELGRYLGKLPEPSIALVRRWPNSLPLYSVRHLDRISELDRRVAALPNLRLIGNAYRGVGLPDLVHSGRTTARELIASLSAN